MATLPAYPSLDQLRHQAKDLLRAAKSGDAAAAAQVAEVSDSPTLFAAQLVVARSYGFPSWPALKAEVQARAASLDELAAEFCVASVRDWRGRAVRMLAQTPEIAGHGLATALMLGDAARVRDEIARDPAVGACAAGDRAAALDVLAAANLTGDQAAALGPAAAAGDLTGRLDQAELAALVYAAEAGNEPAVSLMLDLGFPLDVRRDDGATALHAAAYAGDAPVVRLLLDRGADPEAPDGQWESPALEWAVIGSGFRPRTSPHPDWITTVRVLIEAGASTRGLSLSPDDQKPPSPEVAELLRAYGVGSD